MARPKDNYSYTITDIAKLTKQTPNAVRQHMTRGKFNPAELASVIEYVNSFIKQKVESKYFPIGYMTMIEEEGRQPIVEEEEPKEIKGE